MATSLASTPASMSVLVGAAAPSLVAPASLGLLVGRPVPAPVPPPHGGGPGAPPPPIPARPREVRVSVQGSCNVNIACKLGEKTQEKVNEAFKAFQDEVAAHVRIPTDDLDLRVSSNKTIWYRRDGAPRYERLDLLEQEREADLTGDATLRATLRARCSQINSKLDLLFMSAESSTPKSYHHKMKYHPAYVGPFDSLSIFTRSETINKGLQHGAIAFMKQEFTKICERRERAIADPEKPEVYRRQKEAMKEMVAVDYTRQALKKFTKDKIEALEVSLRAAKGRHPLGGEEVIRFERALEELRRIEHQLDENEINQYGIFSALAHDSFNPPLAGDIATPAGKEELMQHMIGYRDEILRDLHAKRLKDKIIDSLSKSELTKKEKEEEAEKQLRKYANRQAILAVAKDARVKASPERRTFLLDACQMLGLSQDETLGLAPFMLAASHFVKEGRRDEFIQEAQVLFSKADEALGTYEFRDALGRYDPGTRNWAGYMARVADDLDQLHDAMDDQDVVAESGAARANRLADAYKVWIDRKAAASRPLRRSGAGMVGAPRPVMPGARDYSYEEL